MPKKNPSKTKFNNVEIKTLKAKVQIEDIVAIDFPLRKAGNNYFLPCPFCKGNQSLCISKEKQFGHCFSCGESFDVFGYYQKVKGLSFPQAVIEVKKFFNTRSDITFKKLLRASICLCSLRNGNNPTTEQPLDKNSPLLAEQFQSFFTSFDSVVSFLIADFNIMNNEKDIAKKEMGNYIDTLQSLRELNEDDKLKNLFKYLLDLCKIIIKNDYNLGGIVYDL